MFIANVISTTGERKRTQLGCQQEGKQKWRLIRQKNSLKSKHETKYEINLPKQESSSLTTLIRKRWLAWSGDMNDRKRGKQDSIAYNVFLRLINEIGEGGRVLNSLCTKSQRHCWHEMKENTWGMSGEP